MSWNAALQELNISVPQTELEARPQGEIRRWSMTTASTPVSLTTSFSGSYSRFSSGSSKQDSDYFLTSITARRPNVGVAFSGNSSCQNRPGKRAVEPDFHPRTDIASWRSRIQIGQSNTNNVFDSFQFRGAQISSVRNAAGQPSRLRAGRAASPIPTPASKCARTAILSTAPWCRRDRSRDRYFAKHPQRRLSRDGYRGGWLTP